MRSFGRSLHCVRNALAALICTMVSVLYEMVSAVGDVCQNARVLLFLLHANFNETKSLSNQSLLNFQQAFF